MITIKGFPLVCEDKWAELFQTGCSFAGYYFIKPIFNYLPDVDELDDEERMKYEFKDVKEGSYLVGLDLISDRWVNKGFCRMLLEDYGLVLNEANPMIKKEDSSEVSFIFLRFKYIASFI